MVVMVMKIGYNLYGGRGLWLGVWRARVMVMVMVVVMVMKIGYNLEYGGRGLRLGVWQTWVIIRSMAGLGLGRGL